MLQIKDIIYEINQTQGLWNSVIFQSEQPLVMEAVGLHNGVYAFTIKYILCTTKTKQIWQSRTRKTNVILELKERKK